jgi:hypothetical protein
VTPAAPAAVVCREIGRLLCPDGGQGSNGEARRDRDEYREADKVPEPPFGDPMVLPAALVRRELDARFVGQYPWSLGQSVAIQHTARYTELSQERFKDFWRS